MREHSHLPSLLSLSQTPGMWEFSFSCAGNLKKGGGGGGGEAVFLRAIPTWLWRQVTGVHGVHGLSAWWLSLNQFDREMSR